MHAACEAAWAVEGAWRERDNWLSDAELDDDEQAEQDFHQEEVERTTLAYRHALQRLWRATPELQQWQMTPQQLADGVQAASWNSTPCPCGGGALLDLPFALRRPAWGFCDCHEALWHIQLQRSEIKASVESASV